jgi:hypothetical protein
VVVRRHAGVAAAVGAAASAVAILYLWRASQTLAVLDFAVLGVMALIAVYYLATLVDARTPLLVVDDLGVRVRLGHEWRGLPWESVERVVVRPSRGLLRDGRVVLQPRSLARVMDGLDARSRRHVMVNQKMYDAALAVPLGATTRASAGRQGVADGIRALADGRAEVVELDPETLEVVDLEARARQREELRAAEEAAAASVEVEVEHGPVAGPTAEPAPRQVTDDEAGPEASERDDHAPAAEEHPAEPEPRRRSILGGLGTIVSRVAKGRARDVDGHRAAVPDEASSPDSDPEAEQVEADGDAPAPAPTAAPLAAPVALRETRPGRRAEAMIEATYGAAALDPTVDGSTDLPEGRELRRPGSVDLVEEPVRLDSRVRPISTLGDPVDPLVIDDYVTEPAYDPVIGPELTAARTRLGLSVDELAERTRIRPHVIESIEVDDFAPCGGDFYARGHLRTLARILGKDPAPLLAAYEERYATAPINARRVFEAELATGMTGSMRSTVGGPNWGLLVAVVLSLVLVWGVVRLFTAEPPELVEVPAPALNGSAGLGADGPAARDDQPDGAGGTLLRDPVRVRLSASQGDSRVVVRDAQGEVVFAGPLVLGERKTLEVVPPVRVRARDGGAVEIRVAGRERGLLGEAGEPARRTFRAPDRR